ncbi:MAG: hypothetical protein KYX69_19620 [Sphingomonas sp.]|uniref:hypothetical protein n=1 Tax=Sphingomonas sp. TaxID=28214 RepID=UPI00260EA6C2|nr:hypothetical protein [Sphingomonas sp.]MDK2769913.1 hypothetical protein [Sphingomonas sp.]
MVKVIATQRGYFGGEIRDLGASFDVPDDLWKDKDRRPSWAKLDPRHAFGGKGDHDGDGAVGGAKAPEPAAGAAEPVNVPADWRNGSAVERKALAKAISGANVPNAAEADKIITAYVEANAPAPFGDAPAPEAAAGPQGNGVTAALGTAPDWIAPGAQEPSQVD